MSNNKEIQKTETGQSFDKPTIRNTITKIIAAIVLAVMTIFVALIIGLPIYLYIPLGAFVFFFVALGFYLFSFGRANKRLKAEVESLKATSENYQRPPPPEF
jgi:fatty acid desaturase